MRYLAVGQRVKTRDERRIPPRTKPRSFYFQPKMGGVILELAGVGTFIKGARA